MATGFFKHIPDLLYDFKSDGNLKLAKDLFRKVSTWTHLQEGVSGYSYYRITEGERPDVVASKLYGDSTLYWLFFLVNENLQDLNDWPKSNSLFEKYVDRKYPGTCLVASSSSDIVTYDHSLADRDQLKSRKFVLGEKVSQSSSIYGFITDINPTHKRITLNSVNGIFTSSSTVTGADSGASFTTSSIVNEKDAVHHYKDSNGFLTTAESYTSDSSNTKLDNEGNAYLYTTTNNTSVTNLVYERALNEDKHTIRYIEPRYIDRVVREFIQIVRS